MTFGVSNRIRQVRRRRNLSPADLAAQAGLHVNHLGSQGRGESQHSTDTLKRLADVLGTTADIVPEGGADIAAKARLEDREPLRRSRDVKQSPLDDKLLVAHLLDDLLFKRKAEGLRAG